MSSPFPYHLRELPPYPGAYVTVSWGNKQETRPAVIDTGSNRTVIPDWLVGVLHLRQINDEVDISGPQMPTSVQNLYLANLAFCGLTFTAHTVVPMPWPEILIGRDIINKWVLTLDGPNRRFTIESS